MNIKLQLYCNKTFLPVVLSFAEESAKAFGLGKKETFAVRLAMEEVYSYLSEVLQDAKLEIICTNCIYFVELQFLFKGNIPLKNFNLTATISPYKEQDLEQMGLYIASRMVDGFKIIKSDNSIVLHLIKEKSYPRVDNCESDITFTDSNSFFIKKPNIDELKLFSSNVEYFYNAKPIPDFFSYPGKFADMVVSGYYDALIGIDDKNQIVGGIVWHNSNKRLIEFFGPFEFKKNFQKSLKEELIIACLESIGKSDAIGLFCKTNAETLSEEYFEDIGRLSVYINNDKIVIPVWFRQLKEDAGAVSWSHEQLEKFLKHSYSMLFLPRRIEIVRDMGESFPDFSVISANLDRSMNTATLKTILYGKDFANNVSEHVNLLKEDGFDNVFFELDTGVPEQAYVVPVLFKNGFSPKVIIPCAGEGDIVIFQMEI